MQYNMNSIYKVVKFPSLPTPENTDVAEAKHVSKSVQESSSSVQVVE